MRRVTVGLMIVVAFLGIHAVAQADTLQYGNPASWNLLDENYGSGSGQVAFNDSFTGGYWSSVPPTETRYAGKSNLAVASGTSYMVRPTMPTLPTDNSDITIEFKVAALGNNRILAGFADKPSSPNYNHFFLINGVTYPDGSGRSAALQADTLTDYNAAIGSTMTPSGFEGDAAHTYRLIRHDFGSGTATTLYLDNNPTAIGTLISSSGPGGGDNVTWEWGFFGDGGSASYDVYYAKVATGAYVPTPEPSTFAMMVAGVIGLIAYAWRKRR
jgi:hypothetical protein